MAHNASNVKALVYVAALIPDVGEDVHDLQATGSLIGPSTLLVRPCRADSCAAGQDEVCHVSAVVVGREERDQATEDTAVTLHVELASFERVSQSQTPENHRAEGRRVCNNRGRCAARRSAHNLQLT